MNHTGNLVLSFAVLLLVQGCASLKPEEIARPSEVTLEQALKSVGQGLNEMHIAQSGLRTGLLPTEVSVTFNLGVSAKDSSKLTLDFGKTVGVTDIKAGASVEGSSEGTRANSITVKFLNLLVLPESSLAQKKKPEEIEAIIKVLKSAGIDIFFVPAN
ncbi:hypothetical protein [Thauera sp.]|uniref:hypothetical protein n=1 Tax=Thauera sp. TaxID=1905334 RepID=UPI0039E4DF93